MSELRFDHIGVIVPDLATGRAFFAAALPVTRWTAPIDDPGLGVSVQFAIESAGVCYELVAPLGEQSPVSRALAAGRNLLNHVAYRTSDLVAEAARFEALGCHAAGPPGPAVAYAGRPVQFFVSPLRFLIELIEAPEHGHAWTESATQNRRTDTR